jgi:hypothetical protein
MFSKNLFEPSLEELIMHDTNSNICQKIKKKMVQKGWNQYRMHKEQNRNSKA